MGTRTGLESRKPGQRSKHTDHITQRAPEEGPGREPGAEGRRDVARLVVAEAQLLLQRAEGQPEGLGPQQVQQVAEAAEAPDHPLVLAHAHGVDLAVDEHALLVVQAQAVEVRVGGEDVGGRAGRPPAAVRGPPALDVHDIFVLLFGIVLGELAVKSAARSWGVVLHVEQGGGRFVAGGPG